MERHFSLCEKCSHEPIAKGIKFMKCSCCGNETIVNILSSVTLCSDCLPESHCVMCGCII